MSAIASRDEDDRATPLTIPTETRTETPIGVHEATSPRNDVDRAICPEAAVHFEVDNDGGARDQLSGQDLQEPLSKQRDQDD